MPSFRPSEFSSAVAFFCLSFLPSSCLFLQFTISSMSSVLSINSCHPSPSFFSLSLPLLPIVDSPVERQLCLDYYIRLSSACVISLFSYLTYVIYRSRFDAGKILIRAGRNKRARADDANLVTPVFCVRYVFPKKRDVNR